jgi:regulatory protein
MKDKSILMKYAIDYLSKYSSSKNNLIQILKNKVRRLKIEKKDKFLLFNSIGTIVEKLEKNNFINDFNYSISKIRSFIFQGKSRIFIKSYFIQKGVESNIISKALEEFDVENSKWELESAKTYASKKRFTNDKDNRQKNLARMARAGFSYDMANKILNDL